jgi:cytidylate kinase
VQRMYLNGEDVSETIRLPDISLAASDVSALPAVRAYLMDMQRAMAREHDVVMDGRDIGTVVLPDAELKIFPHGLAGGQSVQTVSGAHRPGREHLL